MAKKKVLWYRDSSRPTNLTAPEAAIMRVVWDADGGPITVRDVYETLRKRKRIAYTTVMSVMSKLAAKGFLVQDKSSTAYQYTAAFSDTEVAGNIIDEVVDKVLAGAAAPVISRLLGSRKKLSPEEIDRMEELLNKKR